MKNVLMLIVVLMTSGIQAATTNYVETSVQGLTFSHPANISVTNFTGDGDFEMQVVHLSSTNTFNAMFYLFTNSAGENSAKKLLSIIQGVNSVNAVRKCTVRTIFGLKQKGTALIPNYSGTKLSSEMFLIRESGTWFLLNMVFEAPQDDEVRDAIIASMKYSRPP